MKVSVIIPVYNCEKYLNKCINSVLSQTFQDFEIILVNNGSLDNSAQICVRYADSDSRIKYMLKENNGGAGAPRNKGLEEAKGEYIVFLDADDCLPVNSLEILVREIESMDYDVVIASYNNYSEDGMLNYDTILEPQKFMEQKEVRDYFARVYPNGEAGYLWNKIYKRDIIEHYEVRFPMISRLEDGFFNVDYFSHIDKCKVISEVTYCYKLNAQADLFKKSPPDYYNRVKELTEHYYETIEKWGYEAQTVEGEMCKFFLNELEVCFENLYNKSWNMKGYMRIEYFQQLQQKEIIQYMLNRKRYAGKYVRTVMALFKSENYRMMLMLIRLKLFMKKYFKALYGLLKRI